jgi:hypothetical protein
MLLLQGTQLVQDLVSGMQSIKPENHQVAHLLLRSVGSHARVIVRRRLARELRRRPNCGGRGLVLKREDVMHNERECKEQALGSALPGSSPLADDRVSRMLHSGYNLRRLPELKRSS